MRKLQSGKRFTTGRPKIGTQHLDHDWWTVTSYEAVEAEDEYGDITPGFACEAHRSTEEEIAQYQEARRAARAGRSVWQMLEDTTSER